VIILKRCLERVKYNSKDLLGRDRFDIEVIDAVNGYFEEKDKSYYIEGMKSLSIVKQVLSLEGDYIGK